MKITEEKANEEKENKNAEHENDEQATKYKDNSPESKQQLDNKNIKDSIEESIDLILSDGSLMKTPEVSKGEQLSEQLPNEQIYEETDRNTPQGNIF